MNKLAEDFLKQNFFYTFLKGRLEKGRQSDFSNAVMVIGSSHSLCGVSEEAWPEAVNCSMHSQDIFYDAKCIEMILEDPSSAGKYCDCVLAMGYYMPYQDLSLSKYSRESFISRTYFPIFHDAHNWEDPTVYDHWHFAPAISENDKIRYEGEAIIESQKLRFYSGQTMKRKPFYDFGGLRWEELTEDRKEYFGKMRADSHGLLEAHTDSYGENLGYLKSIVKLTTERKVRLTVVVTPFTRQYATNVAGSMKESFHRMMDEAEVPAILDFNEDKYRNLFDDSLFIDTDHLNEEGSRKFSDILASVLESS